VVNLGSARRIPCALTTDLIAAVTMASFRAEAGLSRDDGGVTSRKARQLVGATAVGVLSPAAAGHLSQKGIEWRVGLGTEGANKREDISNVDSSSYGASRDASPDDAR
jgi:hypothetical protein